MHRKRVYYYYYVLVVAKIVILALFQIAQVCEYDKQVLLYRGIIIPHSCSVPPILIYQKISSQHEPGRTSLSMNLIYLQCNFSCNYTLTIKIRPFRRIRTNPIVLSCQILSHSLFCV